MVTRPEPKFEDRTEQIFVVSQSTYGIVGAAVSMDGANELIRNRAIEPGRLHCTVDEITLHRPSLQPIYGGPTLLEALWNEMDILMERLMTGESSEASEDVCRDEDCGHLDNGDRYRAEELAWVLAIVENAYNPDVDRIRAKAMERWNEGA